MQQQALNQSWRGLGAWNFYFLLKFMLLAYGHLNFHPFKNLVFLAFLLFPLSSDTLHKIRQWVALPIGLVLLYHDTWLPGLHTILTKGTNLFEFSFKYILELLYRFIDWHLFGASFVLLVAYLFISQWLRLTVFTIIGLVWLNLPLVDMTKFINVFPTKLVVQTANVDDKANVTKVISNGTLSLNQKLDQYVKNFYDQESERKTIFPTSLPNNFEPFHIVFIHICSMAWADLNATQQANNPLWQNFDIVFDNFNSVATYSNPAVLRMLRSSCGQTKLDSLFKDVNNRCLILKNLSNIGFERQLVLDHDGTFADFLNVVKKYGGLESIPIMSVKNKKPILEEFNSSPVYGDGAILDELLQRLKANPNQSSVTFFHISRFHDGNRTLEGEIPSYKTMAESLFSDFQAFLAQLEKDKIRTLVVVSGAHGRNYAGDGIQMSGLRDIPTPDITLVPVGVKLIGLKAQSPTSPIQIKEPTSFLALSELLSRMIQHNIFNQTSIDWQALTSNLPETPLVSENESATVVKYNQTYYVRLRGERNWVPLPR